MSNPHKPHDQEPSHTAEAIAHQHNPYKEYGIIWALLMILLFATVGASYLPTGEPWSFVIAMAIAVTKAVLVVLFFMHVKDASRVTWVFCSCSFLWLVIMLTFTFADYFTRPDHSPTAGQGTVQVVDTTMADPAH